MSPAQIAEAERLVAEWKPNPAGCEAIIGKLEERANLGEPALGQLEERAVAALPPPSEAPGSGTGSFVGEWFARNESWLVTLRISHQDVRVRIKCDEASVPYAQSLSANGTIDKDGRISIRIKDLFAHTIYLRGTFPKLKIINTASYCRDRDLEFQRVGAG